MAKKKTAKKIVSTKKVVKRSPEVDAVMGSLVSAKDCMLAAAIAAKSIDGCPEAIVKRLGSLHTSLVKSTDNIEKRLDSLGTKAERQAAAAERAEAAAAKKAEKLVRAKAQAEKLAAKIAKLEA